MRSVLILFLIIPCISFSQVNISRGTPEFSLPVYSYNDNKSGLSFNVSIDYNGGHGIKVSQLASDIGLGWALNCGGVIARHQNDQPDDQHRTNGETYTPYANYKNVVMEENWLDKYIYGDGFLYNNYQGTCVKDPAYSPQWSSLGALYKQGMDALADREQDEFIFTIGGRSGTFIIGKNLQVVQLNDSKLYIEPLFDAISQVNMRTTISGFKVRTENGVIYWFKNYEINEVCAYKEYQRICTDYSGNLQPSCGTWARFVLSKVKGIPLNQFVINNWLLSEIENPITHEKITLNYTVNNLNYTDDILFSGKENDGKFLITRTENQVIAKQLKLQNVIFPDQRKIEFTYADSSRLDLTGDKALKSIRIYYKNDLVTDYRLTQGYFYKTEIKPDNFGFVEADKKHTRLCLNQVQKFTPVASEQPFVFSYFMDPTINMAPRLSNYRSKDYWGYFNYNYATQNGQFDEESTSNLLGWEDVLKTEDLRYSLSDFSKLGMLKSIVYPLGGITEFEYEYNACNNLNVSGQVVGAGGVRVSKVKSYPDATAQPIIKEYKYVKDDGVTSSAWGYEKPIYSLQLTHVQYKAPYQLFTGSNNYVMANAFNQIGKYTANQFPLPKNHKFNARPIMSTLLEAGKSIAIDYLFYVFQDAYKTFDVTDYQMYPYNYSNPLPFQYSQVTVVDKKGASNVGKTVYYFRSDEDVAVSVPFHLFPYSARQRAFNWQYGLPKKIVSYNDQQQPVKEIVNEYADYNTWLTGSNFLNIKCGPVRTHAAEIGFAFNSNIPSSDIISESYYYSYGRTELTKTIEKSYNASGNILTAQTEYTYNADQLLKSTTKTNSNGDKIETLYYYPNDYNTTVSAGISTLRSYGVLNAPVSSETWLYKNLTPAPEKALIAGSVNEYNLIGTGEPGITAVHEFEASAPVGVSVIGQQSPNVLVRNTTYFKNRITKTYNTDGNLFSVTSSGSRVSSFIYEYDKRFVVATIVNDAEGKSAYTSFETESTGNWQFNPAAISSEESITGNKSYVLFNTSTGVSYPITATSLTSTNSYIVTFWAMAGSNVLVNGAAPTIIYQAPGWSLCRKLITGSSTVTVQGTGTIDELRLYPEAALMTTVVYDAALGVKTADCDANNILAFYEYDSFGRLRIVRDADKNIIKTYEYNTKQ